MAFQRPSILLLALSACASSQSAFPMPPAFSPVEDAPLTIGHPGYVAPEPERSPHKRVLPETPGTRRELGIWAAAPWTDDGPAILLGTPLPFPDGASSEPDRAVTRMCAFTLENRDARPVPSISRGAWSVEARACIAARAYLHCARRMVEDYERGKTAVVLVSKEFERRVMKTADTAQEFEKTSCRNVSLPGEASPYLDALLREWDIAHEANMAGRHK